MLIYCIIWLFELDKLINFLNFTEKPLYFNDNIVPSFNNPFIIEGD